MHPQSDTLTRFGDVLDAVVRLSPDEQLALVEIVARRLAEQGRTRVAASVQEARHEFAEGRCCPVTIDELMQRRFSCSQSARTTKFIDRFIRAKRRAGTHLPGKSL